MTDSELIKITIENRANTGPRTHQRGGSDVHRRRKNTPLPYHNLLSWSSQEINMSSKSVCSVIEAFVGQIVTVSRIKRP